MQKPKTVMSQGFGPLFDKAQRAYDNQMPPPEPQCACVSMDAYECARLRDRRGVGFDDEWDDDGHRRVCECQCHDNEDYDDDL